MLPLTVKAFLNYYYIKPAEIQLVSVYGDKVIK